MKIIILDLKSLRNEEHCQFYTDSAAVIAKHQAEALLVKAEYESFLKCQIDEHALLELMTKSFATESLTEHNAKRNRLYRGLILAIDTGLHHYDTAIVAVAERLKIVLKEYGNITRKTNNAESAALSKLTTEAKSIYAKEFETLGLSAWITHLEAANNEFQEVMHRRYEESASKSEGNMKDARMAADAAYTALCNKIDAYKLISNETKYDAVIKAMNAVIEKYANTLAIRKGKKSAKGDKKQADI
jgi:hypothetical protein